jgi:hypothetical protein
MPFFSITSPSSGNATQLQGKAVAATAPATGTVLTYDGGSWRAAQGVTGPAGPYGADGSKIYNGSGAPSAGLGVSGDFYVDTGTGRLYGPKASGSWGAGISIQGGPTGPTGVTGSVGATGATGSVPLAYFGANTVTGIAAYTAELSVTIGGTTYKIPART